MTQTKAARLTYVQISVKYIFLCQIREIKIIRWHQTFGADADYDPGVSEHAITLGMEYTLSDRVKCKYLNEIRTCFLTVNCQYKRKIICMSADIIRLFI